MTCLMEIFKDLLKRAASGKVLRHKAFNIANNPKHDGYHLDLLQWFIIFLIKSKSHANKSAPRKEISINSENQQLAGELKNQLSEKMGSVKSAELAYAINK